MCEHAGPHLSTEGAVPNVLQPASAAGSLQRVSCCGPPVHSVDKTAVSDEHRNNDTQ